jgi:hypothetical protein
MAKAELQKVYSVLLGSSSYDTIHLGLVLRVSYDDGDL